MIKNILIEISYDGSVFKGWQRLPHDLTVQGYLERTLSKLLKCEISINGSGRTDKGVHAINQSFNFLYNGNIPVENLRFFLNNKLMKSIQINNLVEMPIDFHARYSALSKSYIYKINFNRKEEVFYRNYYWFMDELNIELMREASRYLIGKHDYTSFSSIGDKSKLNNPIREIYRIDFEIENNVLIIRFIGNGFLYHMVRIIVHHLVCIGRGKKDPKITREILESRSRDKTNRIAPASGLYLEKVNYKCLT
ncbi:MAG: tRNA pseudouridine(38-40) synthase TruA [Clostridiales bacterium]|nr:tRNA pseudouridine(38-40) synthase TruA [Clostridiales bacterium]